MILLDAVTTDILRCPICRSRLRYPSRTFIECGNVGCGATFPIVAKVPILINEKNSVFRLDDFTGSPPQLLETAGTSIAQRLKRWVPGNDYNLMTRTNFARLRRSLVESGGKRVLIVGGGVLGRHIDELLDEPALEFVETDVWIGPRTRVVCDAHDLPFMDDSFDAVVAQAVLEHVADPARCVAEIHRVLRPGGFVYAETPFMQQVHLGPHDFTRFTPLGHRRLFRHFDEVDSGPSSGPGTALMWAYENFLLAFVTSSLNRGLVKAFARYTSFPLKYLDRFLAKRPAALDAACAVYFLGRKSDRELSDREVIGLYRGAQTRPLAPH